MIVSPAAPPCPFCAQNARDARLDRARAEAAERRIEIQLADAQVREAVLAAALLAAPLPDASAASRISALEAETATQMVEIDALRRTLSETRDNLDKIMADRDATRRILTDLRATWWYRLFDRRS